MKESGKEVTPLTASFRPEGENPGWDKVEAGEIGVNEILLGLRFLFSFLFPIRSPKIEPYVLQKPRIYTTFSLWTLLNFASKNACHSCISNVTGRLLSGTLSFRFEISYVAISVLDLEDGRPSRGSMPAIFILPLETKGLSCTNGNLFYQALPCNYKSSIKVRLLILNPRVQSRSEWKTSVFLVVMSGDLHMHQKFRIWFKRWQYAGEMGEKF